MLWRQFLLKTVDHWSPKPISSPTGGRLRPNPIVKPFTAARIQAGEIRQQAKCAKKSGKAPERRQRGADAAPQTCGDVLYAGHLVINSGASWKLRFSQLEMQEARIQTINSARVVWSCSGNARTSSTFDRPGL